MSVDGVGDVCSFAQMDVRKHGNLDWQISGSQEEKAPKPAQNTCHTNQYTQGEHGKTELSLVHFTMTNPNWKMPNEAREFVHGLRKHALSDLNRARGVGAAANTTAMGQSLISVGSMGGEYSSIVQSILQNHNLTGSQLGFSIFNPQIYTPYVPTSGQQNSNLPSNQSQMYSRHSMDFDRMLQQNLMDTSGTHLRSTLHDISEDADDGGDRDAYSPLTPHVPFVGNESISMSMRGGINRHEGM